MAIDTREKRMSAFSLLVPSYTPGVDPSSIDASERAAAAWVYSGLISAALTLIRHYFVHTIHRKRSRGH